MRGQNVKFRFVIGLVVMICCIDFISSAADKKPAVMISFVDGTEQRFHLDHIDETRVIVLKAGFQRKVIFSPSEIVWMRFRPEIKTKIPEGQEGVVLADGSILNGLPVWMDDQSYWIELNDRKRKRVELKKVIFIQFANSKDAIRIPTVSTDAIASRVNVSATREWTNTNLAIKKGENIWFTVGDYSTVNCSNTLQAISASGVPNLLNESTSVPSANLCSLIGKIGEDGKPFLVGLTRTPAVAQNSGNLFLGVNDNNFKDNSGALDVFVKVIISSAQEEKNASGHN
jgi:hypothetical protein